MLPLQQQALSARPWSANATQSSSNAASSVTAAAALIVAGGTRGRDSLANSIAVNYMTATTGRPASGASRPGRLMVFEKVFLGISKSFVFALRNTF